MKYTKVLNCISSGAKICRGALRRRGVKIKAIIPWRKVPCNSFGSQGTCRIDAGLARTSQGNCLPKLPRLVGLGWVGLGGGLSRGEGEEDNATTPPQSLSRSGASSDGRYVRANRRVASCVPTPNRYVCGVAPLTSAALQTRCVGGEREGLRSKGLSPTRLT
jgi:hypothetical protein